MTDELLHHWVLHEIDEEAARHESERAKLPELRRAQESRVSTERMKVAASEGRMVGWIKRRRELEREITALEEQEKRFQAQMDAVQNQKAYEAAKHEIAVVAAKRSELETQVLTLMDDEERATSFHPTLVAALEKVEREAGEVTRRLDAEEARHAAALAALAERREAAASQLDAATRTRYERVRASRAGRAVAAILKGACGGCFRGLPPHALQEARRRERLLVCDGCGRLMLLPPEGHPEP